MSALSNGGYMKISILLMSLFAVQAFANPFDAFVGKFTLDGKVQIRNFNAKACIRYGIPNLTGIEVKQDTNGYKQSHLIYLNNPSGWSGLPIMQYEDRPDYLNPSIVYISKVQGGANFAELVETSNSNEYYADKFSLKRTANKIIFNFTEEYIKNNSIEAGCYYQAILK
jgi:hypothetical protein